MKRLISANVACIQQDEKIKKMFDAYDRELKGILVFLVAQMALWFAIIVPYL
ncbi:MAG: hypothetical protein AAGF77_10240 [Bacteroidota bacterium]